MSESLLKDPLFTQMKAVIMRDSGIVTPIIKDLDFSTTQKNIPT